MEIEHLKQSEKFSLKDNDEEIGFLKYAISEKIMYINGVVVEPEHRSQGLAKKITIKAIDFARDNSMKIIPRCPYVANMFDKGGYEDVDARD